MMDNDSVVGSSSLSSCVTQSWDNGHVMSVLITLSSNPSPDSAAPSLTRHPPVILDMISILTGPRALQ